MADEHDGLRVQAEGERVREVLRSIVVRMAPEPAGAGAGSLHLIRELAYDSLALLELAFAVEAEFGLRPMDMQTATTIHTSDDLAAYVLAELGLA